MAMPGSTVLPTFRISITDVARECRHKKMDFELPGIHTMMAQIVKTESVTIESLTNFLS